MTDKPVKILALFGKSGAGKDRIQNVLLKQKDSDQFFHKIVSHTTRPKRDYEVEGEDYHFVSKEEFTQMLLDDKFIEAKEYNGWFYAAAVTALDPEKINIGIFTPGGINSLFFEQAHFNLDILCVYVRASDKTRLLRALNREENPDVKEILRRYVTDENDFTYLDYTYRTIWNETTPMDEDEVLCTMIDYVKDFFD